MSLMLLEARPRRGGGFCPPPPLADTSSSCCLEALLAPCFRAGGALLGAVGDAGERILGTSSTCCLDGLTAALCFGAGGGCFSAAFRAGVLFSEMLLLHCPGAAPFVLASWLVFVVALLEGRLATRRLLVERSAAARSSPVSSPSLAPPPPFQASGPPRCQPVKLCRAGSGPAARGAASEAAPSMPAPGAAAEAAG